MKKVDATESIQIVNIETGTVSFVILGTMPLIMNRMTEKAMRELLLPPRKKNTVERATIAKHNPIAEYRSSAFLRDRDDHKLEDTFLYLPSTMFKAALMSAAVDQPGASKAAIGRLTYVPGETINLYGVPRVFSCIVRNSGMNRTPDVRTRAIISQWCAVVPVTYTMPMLTAQAVSNLMAGAGITVGVGDFRQEKGKGSYGQFMITDLDDPQIKRLMGITREQQTDAIQNPVAYDANTQELLEWYGQEARVRGFKGQSNQGEVDEIGSNQTVPRTVRKGRDTASNGSGTGRAQSGESAS